MDQDTYVRGKLAEAAKARGGIARVARESMIDQRTVRALLKPEHTAHVTTLDKLSAYFKKPSRKAKEAM